ncbi:hypothetical protein [Nevskia soli]|uniref:hypothetical protein n=1 Tax=Nevskia soli TaxID=418856 RepID=UPI0015D7D096|nr:hypothetical protein [Nevskia soli]
MPEQLREGVNEPVIREVRVDVNLSFTRAGGGCCFSVDPPYYLAPSRKVAAA